MSVGVECLLTDDPQVAAELASRLDALNRRRREIEGEMKDAAESSLAGLCLDGATLPPGLCLFGEDWHQGVSGIVAARIRERYHRPVIAFANGGDGFLRGSARSVEGVHVRDLIALVDRQDPGLIERFGGHAMAAGLSIRPEALSRFREAFAEAVRTVVGDRPPQPEIASDGVLPQRLMTLETAETLRVAGPWGNGFPEPRFDGTFDVLSARLVGERHLKLRLAGSAAEDGPIEAIGFNLGEQLAEAGGAVRLAYRLDVNDFRGNRSAQLILEHLEPAA
jgi:single-stranded-DNA-specific exonuclease